MSVRLPMFPLGSVLVPHALLPLHVFEPRYRVLLFDCLGGDREFGVVLIERGSEVGGGDQRFDVATVARIAQAREFPDGRWFVLAVGSRRVDVVEWLPADPYPVALVETRPERPWPGGGPGADAAGAPAFQATGTTGADAAAGADAATGADAAAGADAAFEVAERAVRRTLALASEAGEEVPSAQVELSRDRAVAAWQLVAVSPLESLDKQRLLALDDHVERLRQLAAMAEDQCFLLGDRPDPE